MRIITWTGKRNEKICYNRNPSDLFVKLQTLGTD
jgi:hypothetical protein